MISHGIGRALPTFHTVCMVNVHVPQSPSHFHAQLNWTRTRRPISFSASFNCAHILNMWYVFCAFFCCWYFLRYVLTWNYYGCDTYIIIINIIVISHVSYMNVRRCGRPKVIIHKFSLLLYERTCCKQIYSYIFMVNLSLIVYLTHTRTHATNVCFWFSARCTRYR